jgi:hypothetical protein
VHPDLRVDADELAVEGLRQELEVGVGATGPRRAAVKRWLPDLDGGQPAAASSRNSAFMMNERSLMSALSSL